MSNWGRGLLVRAGRGHGPGSKLLHQSRLELAIRRRDRVLVYAPGQTGSMTVARSVRDSKPADLVLHVHALSKERLDAVRGRHEAAGRRWNGRQEWRARAIRRALARDEHPWPVVTTLRDPVAQRVSAFFAGRAARGDLDLTAERTESTLADLTEQLLSRGDGWTLEDWLREEYRPTVGTDLLDLDFDVDRGWAEVQSGRFQILVLRTESLGPSTEDVLARFLAVPSAVLGHRNTTGARPYGDMYRWFLEMVRLPEDYVTRSYESTYARQFYSEAERERAWERWVGGERRKILYGA